MKPEALPQIRSSLKSGVYKHYKGGFYRLVGIARHENTEEEMAVYCSISRGLENGEGPLWVRPVAQFTEEVEYRGKTTTRFIYVSAS